MTSIADLEHRLQLAQEAIEAAYQTGNWASAKLHSHRASEALQKLLNARIEQGEL